MPRTVFSRCEVTMGCRPEPMRTIMPFRAASAMCRKTGSPSPHTQPGRTTHVLKPAALAARASWSLIVLLVR